MKKDDILELEIIDEGMEGEGIAKLDGFVIFVPFVLKGERVKVQVTFVKKSFATAKVIKLLIPSPKRIVPPCPHFRKCGGCDYQHIDYDYQLELKVRGIENCLKKYANIDYKVEKITPSEELFSYRNKVQLPIGEENGLIKVGFFKEKSHIFLPISDCLLQGEWCVPYIVEFEKLANDFKLTAFNERTGKGLLRHLILRKLGESVSVILVINSQDLPHKNEFVEGLKKLDKNVSVHISINTKQNNTIMGDSLKLLYGEDTISCEILGVKAKVSPNAFMQINSGVVEKLYSKVCSLIENSEENIVIEAFSGVGVLSNILAKKAKKVYGIEIVYEAVKNADMLSKINKNDDKITNIYGDVAVELPKLIEILKSTKNELNDSCIAEGNDVFEEKAELNICDKSIDCKTNNFTENTEKNISILSNLTVVLDPPRKGVDENSLTAILSALPTKIIYISCNPATLSRDIKFLSPSYKIEHLSAFDMFPQTHHIETLVCLTRKK